MQIDTNLRPEDIINPTLTGKAKQVCYILSNTRYTDSSLESTQDHYQATKRLQSSRNPAIGEGRRGGAGGHER